MEKEVSTRKSPSIIEIFDSESNDSDCPFLLPDVNHGTSSQVNSSSKDPFLDLLDSMYPITVDQTRQDSVPTQHTLQVHMHHLCCPCSNVIYPYYPPGYRPPMLAQPPPIPRPSYLHHYQYTQLHVNPTYNVPLAPTMAQPLPQSMNQSPPSTVDLAFGPPPRDRRNLDAPDYDEQKPISEKMKTETRDSLLQYPSENTYNMGGVSTQQHSHDNFMDLTAPQVASLSTENYISYLVNGCATGESIAKRNEHRPCFKNIQNLCNRTKSEVVKPNITVSNIHSQGVPWATKDFIFAFVRAINCWCILRGYLGSKDGNLGKIDREISPEFRMCYSKWEQCTKQLTHYLIETFYKLDKANSPQNQNSNNVQTQTNPGPSTSTSTTTTPLAKARNTSPAQEAPTARKVLDVINHDRSLSKEMAALKGVPGILHIPPTAVVEIGDARNPPTESTEPSPRDEESDSESRVYMKPGSYNVPTKHLSSQSNSPRSIEFLETAQNIQNVPNVHHQRKVVVEKNDSVINELLRDKVWRTAQNVTPDFIKQNEESPRPPMAINNNVEKACEVAQIPQQNKEIESWLNNEKNKFDCRITDLDEDHVMQPSEDVQSPTLTVPSKPTRTSDPNTSHCNSTASNEPDASSRAYRKRMDCDIRPLPKAYSFRRNITNTWEYRNGGLTDSALAHLQKIFREVDCDVFAAHIHTKSPHPPSEYELQNPTDLSTIYRKLKLPKYMYLNEVVHDFRHIICCAGEYFTDSTRASQLAVFRDKFEDLIAHTFPSVDFDHITGEPNEVQGSFVAKQNGRSRKSAEGDGDH